MKKLMMAMAAVAMVGAANAAPCSWTAYNLDAKYNGWKIVAIGAAGDIDPCGNVNAGAIDCMNSLFLSDSAWPDTGAKSWTEHYQALASWPDYSQGAVVNGSGSTPNISEEAYPYWSIVFGLFEDGITAGSKYELLSTVYYADAKNPTDSPTFDMSGATVIMSGNLKSDTVPEPTSGLLMLLGMAGLCLRRKQK